MPRTAKPLTSPRLLIQSSAIHAAGCITLDPISKGQRVLEYDGPRLNKGLADIRYAERMVTYLFGVGQGNEVVDGFGTGMFLNHSCDPNCETEDRRGHIYVTATRDIAAGEELVYEYNLYDSDLSDVADCYCGAKQCRGTMYSDLELKRRERAFTRQKASNSR